MYSKHNNVIDATINGLQISVDGNTGGILKLSCPEAGIVLDSKPERAGAIDLFAEHRHMLCCGGYSS